MDALLALALIGSLSAPAPVPAACVSSQVRLADDARGQVVVATLEASCPVRRGGTATLVLDGRDVARARFESLPAVISVRLAPEAAPRQACVRVDFGGPVAPATCHALPQPGEEPFRPDLRVEPGF